MILDKKDKVALEAAALLGFCKAVSGETLDVEMANSWFSRLTHYTTKLEVALDDLHNNGPGEQQP